MDETDRPTAGASATRPLAELDRERRGIVVRIVSEILAMLPDLPGHRGQAARSAAHLLLEHTCPWLDPASRDELALTCERAAVRYDAG